MKHPEIKPDFFLAAFEETQSWDATIIAKTGRIWTIGLYDNTEHTYLCEMRPSLAINPAYFYTENQLSDETEQEVREAWYLALNDQPMFYVHVSDVTPLVHVGNIFEDEKGEAIADYNDETEYQKAIDDYIGEMTCNGEPVWFADGVWRTSDGPVKAMEVA